MVIQENVSLAPLTTLKVGGPARYFVEAKTIAEVNERSYLLAPRILRFLCLEAAVM
jgi:UDP-N-acetylenolpyruvoylglucosamine reductase